MTIILGKDGKKKAKNKKRKRKHKELVPGKNLIHMEPFSSDVTETQPTCSSWVDGELFVL